MRRSLNDKDMRTFIFALNNVGWLEVRRRQHAKNRSCEREFRKGKLHIILKRCESARSYLVMHTDRFLPRSYVHRKPITKSEEMEKEFSAILAEYRGIRARAV